MTDPIEPLKELARRWREVDKRYSDADQLRACADELESLLPALEAEIAALKEPMANFNAWWQKWFGAAITDYQYQLASVKEWCGQAWRAGIATLTEKMACGHPKACWVEAQQVSADSKFAASAIAMATPPTGSFLPHCSACEHERLAVAAALREAQAVARGVYQSGEYENERSAIEAADAVLAMLSAADQKVLDAHDAAIRRDVIKQANILLGQKANTELAAWQPWLEAHDADAKSLARIVLYQHSVAGEGHAPNAECETCKLARKIAGGSK